MKVLVTGGSGFVGKRLKLSKPEWIYVSSKDFNLLKFDDCMGMLDHYKPDAVIHLAARVGGIKDNLHNPASFYYENVTMNTNIVHACHLSKVERLLAALSTCVFPDNLPRYPFKESDVFLGPPTESNFSYGYSKRCMLAQINAYRKQYGLNYSTFAPSNIYGPGDNFDNDKSHFVPAMIKKLVCAKNKSKVVFWGSGDPLRQQLYVDDLTDIIPRLLTHHNNSEPIIISPDENLSIKDMVEICLSLLSKDVEICFNNELDGQFRKDGSNGKFKSLFKDFKFTNFKLGLEKTINWYLQNENGCNNRN